MNLQAAWDANAEAWVKLVREEGTFFRTTAETFLELLPPPVSRILDLGCGEGRLGRLLVHRGDTVVGIDTSPTMVRYACERHEAVVADAAALPFADGSFDAVTSFMSFHDMEDVDAVAREAARMLTPSGCFCIAVKHPFISISGALALDELPKIVRPYLEPFVYTPNVGGQSVHRPLEAYAGSLERAGFLIDALREPRFAERPNLQLTLHLRAVKT